MAQVNSVHSTPPTNTSATNPAGQVDPTRRGFITLAAGASIISVGSLAAVAMPVGAAPVSDAPVDPIFSLIEAHRTARAAYLLALAEQNRLDEIGDLDHDWVADDQCGADADAFEPLLKTAPTTFAGLVAWASYLDKIGRHDGEAWMFEGEGPTLVATLVESLDNLAVTS
jgi:hypothetical protein